jgi:ADP-heptose:LPS heptosyltransferase
VLGAGWSARVWPYEKLAELLLRTLEQYPNARMTLLGTREEEAAARRLADQLGDRVTNRVGSTTLFEVIDVVSAAQLAICNESAAYHIAVATRTNVICFLGGGHYGWFAPYPAVARAGTMPLVRELSVRMDCFFCDWRCRFPKVAGAVRCIAAIEVASAVSAVKEILG